MNRFVVKKAYEVSMGGIYYKPWVVWDRANDNSYSLHWTRESARELARGMNGYASKVRRKV